MLNDVTPEDDIGGQATFLRNIIPYLAVQYEVRLLSLPRTYQNIRWIPRRFLYMVFILYKFRVIRKADIIFSNTPESAFVATFFNGKRLFHIFHGNTNPITTSKFWYGKYFRSVFVAFDKRILEKSRKCYTVGEDREGCSFLYQPIDTAFLKSIPALLQQRKDFLFVGRLEEVKQVDKILLAFKEYLLLAGGNDQLIICGTGILEEKYHKLCRDLGLQDNVQFTGKRKYEEVIALMKSAKVLLMASLYEGFPMVIAEAQCCGLPVLSSDVGSISKVIRNGVNGMLLPIQFTSAQYAGAIQDLLNLYPGITAESIKRAKDFDAEYLVKNVLLNDFEERSV